MDREEQQTGEGGRDSPVARLERAITTGSWRRPPRPRQERPLPPPRPPARRYLRKRILALLLLVVLPALVVGLIVAARQLNCGDLTVLVLGLDDSAGRLPDTIVFLRADTANGEAALLSVPRDTWVTGADGKGHKANALLNEPDGLSRLARSLHLAPPPHRVALTSGYLPRLVDAVGGVDVDVGPAPLNSYDKAGKWHIHLPAGKQHLDGEQAFGYLRFRKPRSGPCPFCGATWKKPEGGDASDLARIARQQTLVRGVLAKLRGPGLLWRAPRLLWAARTAHPDLTFWQFLALGNCLRRAGAPQLVVYPTRFDGKHLLPEVEQTTRLEGVVQGILAGRVIVRNGTGSPGLARRAATVLAKKGFLVLRTENTSRTARTVIEGPAELGREVQQALGYGSCAYRDSNDVVVTIGLDAPNPD